MGNVIIDIEYGADQTREGMLKPQSE